MAAVLGVSDIPSTAVAGWEGAAQSFAGASACAQTPGRSEDPASTLSIARLGKQATPCEWAACAQDEVVLAAEHSNGHARRLCE